jgi:hypothetical protein
MLWLNHVESMEGTHVYRSRYTRSHEIRQCFFNFVRFAPARMDEVDMERYACDNA